MPLLRRDMSDQTERTSSVRDDESNSETLYRILSNLLTAISHPVSSALISAQSRGQYGNDDAPNEQSALTSLLWSNRRILGKTMCEIGHEISEPLDTFFSSSLVPAGSTPEKILLGLCSLGDPYVLSEETGICLAVVVNKPHQWANTTDPSTGEPVVIDGPQHESKPVMIGWADAALLDPIGSATMQDDECPAEAWLNSVRYQVYKVTGGQRANTQPDFTGDEPMDEERLIRLRKANGVHDVKPVPPDVD